MEVEDEARYSDLHIKLQSLRAWGLFARICVAAG